MASWTELESCPNHQVVNLGQLGQSHMMGGFRFFKGAAKRLAHSHIPCLSQQQVVAGDGNLAAAQQKVPDKAPCYKTRPTPA